MVKRNQYGGAGRILGIIAALLVVTAMGALVIYLLSDINHRKYKLTVTGGGIQDVLVIQRGLRMPMGFEKFVPKADALKEAYTTIKIPQGQTVETGELFEDRADLDRALFSLLASWSRELFKSSKPQDLGRAAGYIARAEILPGLSELQRQELATLRADMAYRNGKRLLRKVVKLLGEAKTEFELSLTLKTSRKTDAADWIYDIDTRLQSFGIQPKKPTLDAPRVGVPQVGAPQVGTQQPGELQPGGLGQPQAPKTPTVIAPPQAPPSGVRGPNPTLQPQRRPAAANPAVPAQVPSQVPNKNIPSLIAPGEATPELRKFAN